MEIDLYCREGVLFEDERYLDGQFEDNFCSELIFDQQPQKWLLHFHKNGNVVPVDCVSRKKKKEIDSEMWEKWKMSETCETCEMNKS